MNVTDNHLSGRFQELRDRHIANGVSEINAARYALIQHAMELGDLERAAECPTCGSKVYDEERRKKRRADAIYCSGACRQSDYRRRKREA